MYAEPLEVWDEVEQTEDRSEDFTSVSTGEEIELSHKNLIQDAFTVDGSKQDVVITESGSVASTSDYEVDLRDGTIEWNGADSVDLSVRYKTAPLPNSVMVQSLESATEEIDARTNTTFGGTENTVDTYDAESRMEELILFNRPVDTVNQVRVNKAKAGDSDDFKTYTEGRSEDYIHQDDLSIYFNPPSRPRKGKAKIEVDYDYGYQDVPKEIRDLCIMLAVQDLTQNNIAGEIIDGREDYDPRLPDDFINDKEDIISRWRQQRMNEPVPANLQ